MTTFVEPEEIEEIKQTLAKWAEKIPTVNISETVSFTEEEFYTLAKRVMNLERQNKENAKLRLSDFLTGDILHYLMENQELRAHVYVDKSHEYDVKTNLVHIHGSGEDRIIIIY